MRDIDVYGYIGDGWDEDSVSASDFVRMLREAGGEDVTVHINSGGGDVFDASAMAEAIRSYRGRVTASVEGLAASAASYFALTADEVVMNPSALLMIHNPTSVAYGEAADMRRAAERLDKVRGTIVGQYAAKTGIDAATLEGWMDEETWFSADEALSRGFVDRLTDEPPVAACVSERALARYRHAPEGLSAAPGEGEGTIRSQKGGPGAEGGAPAAAPGAGARTVCVNGQFLNA